MENISKSAIVHIIGIIAGIVIFITGVNMKDENNFTRLKDASFGADFYTYTYDGIRETDKTLNALRNDLAENIGTLVSAVGLCLCFICAGNLERSMQNAELIDALRQANSQSAAKASSAPLQPDNASNSRLDLSSIAAGSSSGSMWKCPQCSESNPITNRTCKGCGYQK